MPQILPIDEIAAKGKNSLNSKKGKDFNVVHLRAKDYIKFPKYDLNQRIHFFQAMDGQDAISKTLLYLCKNSRN